MKKTKYKKHHTSKKSKNIKHKPQAYSFFKRMLFFTVIAIATTLFITFASSSGVEPIPQKAYSAENTYVLIPSSFLSPSPSPTPGLILSTLSNLDEPDILNQASQSAITSESEVQNFCLDVPVLFYHHIQPNVIASQLGHEKLTVDSNIFDQQMDYLVKNNYNVISAADLANALLARAELPQKSIVITIDDGYDDSYTYAYMIAKKYNIIINFMIPTALIGKPGYMNWDHLKEMSANSAARLYNHTTTHAAVGLLPKIQIESEISTASADMESYLGQRPEIFTYPYGSFSPVAIDVVKEQGFIGAFSTIDGKRQCVNNILTLPRTRVGNAPLSTYGL